MLPESDAPEEIMKCLNCVRSKCINCLEYGLKPESGDVSKKIKIASSAMQRLYMAGLTDPEIAKKLKCHRHTVYKWRIFNELPRNSKQKQV